MTPELIGPMFLLVALIVAVYGLGWRVGFSRANADERARRKGAEDGTWPPPREEPKP
jgi:hypothetical protein